MKKPTRKSLIKKLDKIFSEFIRKRDGECLQCKFHPFKIRTSLTAGHLITRAKYSVRWDERNVFGQCRSHNFKHEFEPELMTRMFLRMFGLKAYEKLILDSNQIRKFTNQDLTELINKYESHHSGNC